MKDAINTSHRRAHALFVGDVAGRELNAVLGQVLGVGGLADERGDLVTGGYELARDMVADETGRARDESISCEFAPVAGIGLWEMDCAGEYSISSLPRI